MEAVKQGSAIVGARSNTHAVVAAVKRSQGELASYQKKLIKVDDHIGVAISGLTSDARVLSNYMRTLSMRQRILYKRKLPINRVAESLATKAQANTNMLGLRPYGVGLLIIGYDTTGPHLYEFSPSGNLFEFHATSIGSRSQSARTYLERHYETFPELSKDELIVHALQALQDTLQQDKTLDVNNCSIAVVGKNEKLTIIENEAIVPYLEQLAARDDEGQPPAAAAAAATAGARAATVEDDAMDIDDM
ncbi:20S proteasome subunit [Ramicandelaber brevisporus]|nr:20S proteasome subunit [Ramicandelaber brevisporus]